MNYCTKGNEDGTDYKTLLEEALEREENYKRALQQKRQLRQKPQDPPPSVDDEDDNRPLTRAELKNILHETVTPVLAQSVVDRTLTEITKNPQQRELVKLYYETRVRQTGTSDEDIRNDLQTALDLVEAQKLRKVNSELARKAMSKDQPPLSGSGSDNAPDPKNHKFSDDQVKKLTEIARARGAEPKKFIEQAWKNQQR